jgi:hypothetical protein
MPRLFDHLSRVGHVVVELKVLDDFHRTVTPFLSAAHKFLEHFPLSHSSGEVHVAHQGNNLVPGLLCSQILHLMLFLANKLYDFLGLHSRKIEIRGSIG